MKFNFKNIITIFIIINIIIYLYLFLDPPEKYKNKRGTFAFGGIVMIYFYLPAMIYSFIRNIIK